MAASAPPSRLRVLDLLRGLAVLGILTVNIASFADVSSAAYRPRPDGAPSPLDSAVFAAVLVLFEGKMRALFSILFGASLLLFVDRADAAGQPGAVLQARRLGWLAVIGYVHFLLLWDGDILFLYAMAGLAALALRRAEALPMVACALLLFTAWQGLGMARWLPAAMLEQAVASGQADAGQRRHYETLMAERRQQDAEDIAALHQNMAAQVGGRLQDRPFWPLRVVVFMVGETLSYVLLGMALMRGGFFSGGWQAGQLRLMAVAGIGLGGAATLAFTGWAMAAGWPEMAMHTAINHALSFPHLLMALGYAALLVLAAPDLLASGLGRRLEAAGQMAFSNYIATSVVMTALFSGWGLGLFGAFGQALQWPVILLVWALMLGWSAPWLQRHRHGPLEWLWRGLTEWRIVPLRQ